MPGGVESSDSRQRDSCVHGTICKCYDKYSRVS